MTLCIAALAKVPATTKQCIILCFDLKIAGDEFGSETEYKMHVLGDRVMALMAGRAGCGKELALIYRQKLRGIKLTEHNVLDILRDGLGILKDKLADAYVRRRLAVSYSDLLNKGARWFGKNKSQKYISDIERHELGVDMIFAGFMEEQPFICQLQDGEITWATNFSLIGTGAYSAEPALHARRQTPYTSLRESLYNVYEAKRIGETSPFVGKETMMYVLHSNEKGSDKLILDKLTREGHNILKAMFEKYGPRPFPPDEPPSASAFVRCPY